MPIYEYRCEACGHQFEKLQRISDKPIRKCPDCGVNACDKLISRTSFVLKGGGWYAQGYGKGGAKKSDAGEGGSDASKPRSDASASSSASDTSGSSSPAAKKSKAAKAKGGSS